MSIMHLRLELPAFVGGKGTSVAAPAPAPAEPPHDKSSASGDDVCILSQDQLKPPATTTTETNQSLEAAPTPEIGRAASMNLETDVGAWGATGLLLPGISGTQSSHASRPRIGGKGRAFWGAKSHFARKR